MTRSLCNRYILAALLSGALGFGLPAFAGGGKSGSDEVKMMDKDGDGAVSQSEHAAGAQAMFAKLDTDHDGRVTTAEMDAAHAAKHAKHQEHATHDSASADPSSQREQQKSSKLSSAEKIKVIDTNGDGVLSAAEHEAGSRSMFEKMDQDRDGKLTAEEIQAGHQKMLTKQTR